MLVRYQDSLNASAVGVKGRRSGDVDLMPSDRRALQLPVTDMVTDCRKLSMVCGRNSGDVLTWGIQPTTHALCAHYCDC